eukprot:CAMPEP_0174366796 /NCGR_PEP_ID=MMETSP0811_2-20130205/82627_1 /TAXON_ID=73025 ORGANISM="Eutreptiella gymnastica-like, Strain CCMP1594" /NCGR_SAMPLE_ID=MMETSP0811_2 /ASSEMBLY_ACC=CAM_ASM_000667 /LENGTH=171 /DNA_ID=CAMNT_0015508705 /DNA_START=58 /DNA_END=573 /DNA_ORIENTATION=-
MPQRHALMGSGEGMTLASWETGALCTDAGIRRCRSDGPGAAQCLPSPWAIMIILQRYAPMGWFGHGDGITLVSWVTAPIRTGTCRCRSNGPGEVLCLPSHWPPRMLQRYAPIGRCGHRDAMILAGNRKRVAGTNSNWRATVSGGQTTTVHVSHPGSTVPEGPVFFPIDTAM